MTIGPNGEKRPTDVAANAVHVMRVATRQTKETYVNGEKSAAGQKGGIARSESLDAERRSEIAKNAAERRWKGRRNS